MGRGALDQCDGFAFVEVCHGGLSNRLAAQGYHGGFVVVAVDFRCGLGSWWRWRVAMVVGVGD